MCRIVMYQYSLVTGIITQKSPKSRENGSRKFEYSCFECRLISIKFAIFDMELNEQISGIAEGIGSILADH